MNRKRFFSILLAPAPVLSLVAVPVFAEEAGDETLTRGESVSALFAMSGVTGKATDRADFADVPADGTVAPAIRWAAENGIVNGYGDGRFGPDDPVMREQMATMLYRNAQTLGHGLRGMWYFLLDYIVQRLHEADRHL